MTRSLRPAGQTVPDRRAPRKAFTGPMVCPVPGPIRQRRHAGGDKVRARSSEPRTGRPCRTTTVERPDGLGAVLAGLLVWTAGSSPAAPDGPWPREPFVKAGRVAFLALPADGAGPASSEPPPAHDQSDLALVDASLLRPVRCCSCSAGRFSGWARESSEAEKGRRCWRLPSRRCHKQHVEDGRAEEHRMPATAHAA